MIYRLEVEREGERSDHGCDRRRGRDDVQAGGGEEGREVRSRMRPSKRQGRRTNWRWRGRREVRSRMRPSTKQGRRTSWRWRGRARGQITDATINEAGTTYRREVEGKGERSDHRCDRQRGRDREAEGGGEGGREARSREGRPRGQGR